MPGNEGQTSNVDSVAAVARVACADLESGLEQFKEVLEWELAPTFEAGGVSERWNHFNMGGTGAWSAFWDPQRRGDRRLWQSLQD